MTLSKQALARRRAPNASSAPPTVIAAWRAAILEMLEAKHRITFPSVRFRSDPVGFFRFVLGLDPWSEQVKVLEAVRDFDYVAWKSGRRVGKSYLVAGLALWFYCCFEYAQVVLTSTSARQVDAILWRSLSILRAKSGRCLDCANEDPRGLKIPKPCPHSAQIDGDLGQLARTGLKSEDGFFRHVWGFTAKEGEAAAGIAGPNMLVIADEASGIPQSIFDALLGNAAGGMKMVMTGNPTRTSGYFFDAFHKNAMHLDKSGAPIAGGGSWRTLSTSSESSPNVTSGKRVIEALATREWIRERQHEWGVDSPLYRIHVLGEFATNEDGKIFSVDRIRAAEERHAEASDAGRLFLGVDPAGATGTGDESAFTARRGVKEIPTSDDGAGKLVKMGLDTDGHVAVIVTLLAKLAAPREVPVVVIDRGGKIGSDLYGALVAYVHDQEREHRRAPFEVVGVRASDKAVRQPFVYDTVRDELAASLEQAFRDGAAILEDTKCSAELHVLEWKQHTNGRLKVTPKDEIRKKLGRSPDRYDSLALAFWDPMSLASNVPASAGKVDGVAPRRARDEDDDEHEERAEERINPYGARR